MAGALKKTTGLTGLLVEKNPHQKLSVLYTRILNALDEAPADSTYRKSTEPLIREKFDHVKTERNISKLEEKLGVQVEESISLAENELLLARRMLSWKPWLPLETKPPKDQWKWPI